MADIISGKDVAEKILTTNIKNKVDELKSNFPAAYNKWKNNPIEFEIEGKLRLILE